MWACGKGWVMAKTEPSKELDITVLYSGLSFFVLGTILLMIQVWMCPRFATNDLLALLIIIAGTALGSILVFLGLGALSHHLVREYYENVVSKQKESDKDEAPARPSPESV